MKINMGKTDRIIRGIVGIAVIAAGVYYMSWWGAIGAIPLGTAIIGWCPVYLPFGISSCKTGEQLSLIFESCGIKDRKYFVNSY